MQQVKQCSYTVISLSLTFYKNLSWKSFRSLFLQQANPGIIPGGVPHLRPTETAGKPPALAPKLAGGLGGVGG